MSRSGYGLYILHYSVLASAACLLTGGFNISGCAMPPVLVYLGTTAAVFCITPLLNELIRRIPILRWCILGIG